MANRKKKSDNETTTKLVLVTAILTLLNNLITLVIKLIELLSK